jgi:hypothetical protein
MTDEHHAAGPCDPFLAGWDDYQAARRRFFADRAAEARAYAEARRSDEAAGPEPAAVSSAAAEAGVAA